MERILIALSICVTFQIAALGQELELWKGVAFGMSSAAVIEKAGKPKNVKVDNTSYKFAVSSDARERNDFQKLTYQKVDGWQKVVLSFLDDKLVGVELWPKNKRMEARGLPEKFTSDFLLVEAFAKGVDLAAFAGQKETSVPKVYPAVYYMLAVRDREFVIALINNGSFKAIFKDGLGKPTIKMFPGYVERIVIASRAAKKD